MSGSKIQLAGAVLQAVLGENDGGRAEAVGLDDIAAGLKERGVKVADDIGTREHQQLVATLFAPEILGGEVAILQIAAHRAVIDQHAPFQF